MDHIAESEKLVILNIALERSQEVIYTIAEKLKSLDITVDAVIMKKIFSELSVYFEEGNELEEINNLEENPKKSSVNVGSGIVDFKILEDMIKRGNQKELNDDDIALLSEYHLNIYESRRLNNDVKHLIINEIERILRLNNIRPDEIGNEMQTSDESDKDAVEKEAALEEFEDENEFSIISEEINLLKGYFSIIMNYLKINIPTQEINSKIFKKIDMLSNLFFDQESAALNEGVNEDQIDDTLTPIDNVANENSGNQENIERNDGGISENKENSENKVNLGSEIINNHDTKHETIKGKNENTHSENIEIPQETNVEKENVKNSKVNENVETSQTEKLKNVENIQTENVDTENVDNTQANENNIGTEDLNNFYKSNILNEKNPDDEEGKHFNSLIMSKSEEINKKADYFKERAEKYYQKMRKKYFKYIRTPHIVENLEFVRDKFDIDLFKKNNDFATSLTEAEDYLTRVIKGFESFRQKGRVYGGFIRNSRGNYLHNRAFRFYPTMSIMKRAQSSSKIIK